MASIPRGWTAVEELVERRFGRHFDGFGKYICARDLGFAHKNVEAEIQSYRTDLSTLSTLELHDHLSLARDADDAALKLENQERDRIEFFNDQRADADFAHWGRVPSWTVDEATALSFGKDPKVVNLETLDRLLNKPFAPRSEFAAQYVCRNELILRSQVTGQLNEAVQPNDFKNWAREIDLEIPLGLIENIRVPPVRNHGQENSPPETKPEGTPTEREQALLKRNADLVARNKKLVFGPKGLGRREWLSVAKILQGVLAVHYKYTFVSAMERTSIATDIYRDLADTRFHTDVDTIRAWVRESGRIVIEKTIGKIRKPNSD